MDDVLTALRAVLTTTPTRWSTLANEMPDEVLHRTPAPNEWSAVDCLRHLRDAERDVFQVRLMAFRTGQDIVPYDPDTQGKAPASESTRALVEDFSRLRATSLERLAEMKPDDLSSTVTHQVYGPVRLREMLYQWAAHDLMHTVQAERSMMQSFITGCGPWRVTFADHDGTIVVA
jgi:DinB superfamily